MPTDLGHITAHKNMIIIAPDCWRGNFEPIEFNSAISYAVRTSTIPAWKWLFSSSRDVTDKLDEKFNLMLMNMLRSATGNGQSHELGLVG